MEDKKNIFDKLMDIPLLCVFRPFYKQYKEQLLYLFFGALTTFLNLFVFWLTAKLLPPLWANVIAWVAGVVFAYVTNRIWVFRSQNENIFKELVSFSMGRLATLALEELVLYVGINVLGANIMVVKIIAQFLVIVGNYVVSKWLVFR